MQEEALSELRLRVEEFFHTKMYKEACIGRYDHTWDHLSDYMDEHGLRYYTSQVGQDFLNEWHQQKAYKALSHRQKERVRHISVLTDMLLLGSIRRGVLFNKEYEFEGELGAPFRSFIEEQEAIKKRTSVRRYEERIHHLYSFLKDAYKTLSDFDVKLAIRFIKKLDDEENAPNRNNIVMTTRVFLRYLCEHDVLQERKIEIWMSLFKIKYVRNKKIPSVYTEEEVKRIIAAVDRTHPQGKRDYAMVLLAARYGLRVSDIIGLRFCNLSWEQNKIILVQQKTGKKVSLPLSQEVGEAIIEYIEHGRPNVNIPFVFITAKAPYKELSSNVMSGNIADWMRYAGINSTGKKAGPHALRHSLATNLLGLNNPLPVISEILGHVTIESTTTYTRVSIDMLRQCALDVPFVPSSFYYNLYE
jgi:site-specific recombinase XerD